MLDYERGSVTSAPAGWTPWQSEGITQREYIDAQSDNLIIEYSCACGTHHFRYSEDWKDAHLVDPLDWPIVCRCGRAIPDQPREITSNKRQAIEFCCPSFARGMQINLG